VREALPVPHDPTRALSALARFDRQTIAERLEELALSDEERDVLTAELESLAHAPLDQAGAVSVLRWHALSGYSLELNVDVETRDGSGFAARAAVVAVPLNALGAIEFAPALPDDKVAAIALGQASRGIKIFIRARGAPVNQNAIRPGHPFGYLDTDSFNGDGSQLMIGFGADAERCDAGDLAAVQDQLDAILPGYEVIDATAHDWFSDKFSRGTWAIHRPGWYEHHHAAMQRREGRVVFAGSDIADGWSGFIDGAIESGLRAGARAAAAGR
jgi:monoamine oxidase